MEYTKENVLNGRYAKEVDYSGVLRFKKAVAKNRFIIILLTLLVIFASVNIMLVNKFMQGIQSMGDDRYTYLEEYIK